MSDSAESIQRAPGGWTHSDWVAYTQLYVNALVAGVAGISAFVTGFSVMFTGLVLESGSSTGVVITHISTPHLLGGGLITLVGAELLLPAFENWIEARVAIDLKEDPIYDFEKEFFDNE